MYLKLVQEEHRRDTQAMLLKSSAALLALTALLATGCASQGEFKQATGTGVQLTGNNYRVIKAGASGESAGFYLLGFIPIVSPSYADAKNDLYSNVGRSLEGRSVALANQTEDRSSLYLIVFSIPKVKISADVIEFTDAAGKK
jgi:hypothetical protein